MAIFLFPVWAVLVSILAYLFPALLTQLKSWIIPLLVMVMLSMGLTLTWKDFTRIVSYRNIVMVGVAIQFLVMPLAAWLISLLLGLSSELMTGMMLDNWT